MRFITFAFDRTETNDFAEIHLTKDLAVTILTARKKLRELKDAHPELSDLQELCFDGLGKVYYFERGRLGVPNFREETDSGEVRDRLTEEQRLELEENEVVQVPDDFKLRQYKDEAMVYDTMAVDTLVVTEEYWKFLSYNDEGFIESLALEFDLLQRVL